jgi:hypothetical protein
MMPNTSEPTGRIAVPPSKDDEFFLPGLNKLRLARLLPTDKTENRLWKKLSALFSNR